MCGFRSVEGDDVEVYLIVRAFHFELRGKTWFWVASTASFREYRISLTVIKIMFIIWIENNWIPVQNGASIASMRERTNTHIPLDSRNDDGGNK